jgi:hypothetical protein
MGKALHGAKRMLGQDREKTGNNRPFRGLTRGYG